MDEIIWHFKKLKNYLIPHRYRLTTSFSNSTVSLEQVFWCELVIKQHFL